MSDESDFHDSHLPPKNFLFHTTISIIVAVFFQAIAANASSRVLLGWLLVPLIFALFYGDILQNEHHASKEAVEKAKNRLMSSFVLTSIVSVAIGIQFEQGNFSWFLDFVKDIMSGRPSWE